MSVIEDLADWVKSKKRILETLNFIDSFVRVDDSRGVEEKTLIFYVGNSEIRLNRDNLEVAYGTLNATKIFIEKDRVFVKYQDGRSVDMEDVRRVLEFTFRENIATDPIPSGESYIEAITSPLTYDATTKTLGIQTANASQSGVLSASNWLVFNNKQAGSTELTNIANIAGSGLVFRSSTGTYSTVVLNLGTMANQNSNSVSITGGSISGVSFSGSISGSSINNNGQTISGGNMSSVALSNCTINNVDQVITGGTIDLPTITFASLNNSVINSTSIGATTASSGRFTRATIQIGNAADIGLTINTFASGANAIRIVRDSGVTGFQIYNTGSIEVADGSFYRHSGNQVIGTRRTGWTSSGWNNVTGSLGLTLQRTAPTTTTPTTTELLRIIAALVSDLGTPGHGLIDR
jgi:hypothetical protein